MQAFVINMNDDLLMELKNGQTRAAIKGGLKKAGSAAKKGGKWALKHRHELGEAAGIVKGLAGYDLMELDELDLEELMNGETRAAIKKGLKKAGSAAKKGLKKTGENLKKGGKWALKHRQELGEAGQIVKG